jgi:type I restriction enzyme S subunit
LRNDGEWKNNTLGDVADRIVDKVGKQKLITVSISAGLGFVSQAEKFSRDISGKQYKNYIHLKKGEFAYNKGNSKKFPQGCVYKLKEFDEAATPNAFICFRFKNKVVPDFYQGYFDNNYHGKQLLKFITSGARMDGLLNISPFDFFSIQLPTPTDKREQQKIAACLSSLDELIAAHNDKLDALKDHKKGLLQNLFPNNLNHDSKGFKDDHDLNRDKKSSHQANPINQGSDNVPKVRFPEFAGDGEWVEKPLDKICKLVRDGTHGGALKIEIFVKDGFPLITSKNLHSIYDDFSGF